MIPVVTLSISIAIYDYFTSGVIAYNLPLNKLNGEINSGKIQLTPDMNPLRITLKTGYSISSQNPKAVFYNYQIALRAQNNSYKWNTEGSNKRKKEKQKKKNPST